MQRIERDVAALTMLRQRVAAVEETNEELVAFARGHAYAAAAIHEAVLALLAADDASALATIVTRDWPVLLGVDAAAIAWSAEGRAFVADRCGMRPCEPRLVARMAGMERAVVARVVGRGHPLFGGQASTIRAEVSIRMEGARGIGLIVLGETQGEASNTPAGARLLRFLGRICATMLERCPPTSI